MASLFDLSGKVALVTGGNNGIGLGMAEGLAQHGAAVVIWGTNTSRNAEAADRIRSHGGEVRHAQVDVSDEAAVAAAMQAIVDEFGRIDQAIANAGISISRKSVFDITEDDFRRIEAVNVHGVLFTLREAARHMIVRHESGDSGGSLIGISSTSAIHGAARNEHYAATKGAVVTMVRALAVELARYGITANSVLPGWTRSGMTAGLQEWDKFNDAVIGRVPMGDWLDGSDFAAIAVYFASRGARHHTGDTVVIDGGYTIF